MSQNNPLLYESILMDHYMTQNSKIEFTPMTRDDINRLIWQRDLPENQNNQPEWPAHILYIHDLKCDRNKNGTYMNISGIDAPNSVLYYRGESAHLSNSQLFEFHLIPKSHLIFDKGSIEIKNCSIDKIKTRDVGNICIYGSQFGDLETKNLGLKPIIAIDKESSFYVPKPHQEKAVKRGDVLLTIREDEKRKQEMRQNRWLTKRSQDAQWYATSHPPSDKKPQP